ncbi:hypothetical protein HPODL_03152 [Ogataea parapolymorpha DL-1]|uniref:Uncharacterized protein n=1 Tax=Ogataea parapolymorpha (strain ATCC 26012 / BCRC 20466 / JCM 22074 / NRRL Y-7560 / DL-1) TaxID=871575 RepID=W1Q937_OGAPD|nr:hypothetical protein HPODL_03152 [Ogataea parapolymorpha DL-1]ESW96531.1 hypothetical protein HPODL_03152 [Ogataea parapolymorpha DL-1]
MITILPMYYAVITLLSLVLLKNFEIITLPEIPLTYESVSPQKQKSGVQFYELFQKVRLYFLNENKHVQNVIKFGAPYYTQIKETLFPTIAVARKHLVSASRPVVEQISRLAPYYNLTVAYIEPRYKIVKELLSKTATEICAFSADVYDLFSSKLTHYYSKYLEVHVSELLDGWKPVFDQLAEQYETKVRPFVDEHIDTISVAAAVLVVVLLPRAVFRIFGLFMKSVAKDAHELNQGVTNMYKSNSEDLVNKFGTPEFEDMLGESGGINDGITELGEASSLRSTKSTSGSNNSTQRRLGDIARRPAVNKQRRHSNSSSSSSSGGSPVRNSGRNRTPLQNKQTVKSQSASPTSTSQPATPNKRGKSAYEGNRAQEQGVAASFSHEESLNQIRIGCEVYEVTSDILSATTQDLKSIRQKNSKLFSLAPQLVESVRSAEHSSISDEVDSLIESNNFDSVPLSVRAESINRILNSPLRMARSAASNASFKSGSPHRLGIMPPSLAFVSSSPSAAPALNHVNVYTNDQIENPASSVQYLSDISNGRISPSSPQSSDSNYAPL